MESPSVAILVFDLLLVLVAGLLAGMVCKRIGVSVLVGYLVIGAAIGEGGVRLLAGENYDLKHLAETGALLLLFSIGIEFSFDQFLRMGRFLLLGGSVQMVLVAVPMMLLERALGMEWGSALLVGAAVALSSTVLVFKALEEYGEVGTPHGRRAMGILLFQDFAVVPLILLVPLLSASGEGPGGDYWFMLARNSVIFIAAVVVARFVLGCWIVPLLAGFRSTELVVLFALAVLGGAGFGAYALKLPPALGAFAAGLVLSGNRLTAQIDALVLPLRETFAAVFFVSLGTLMQFGILWTEPLLCVGGLVGVVLLKTGAAAVALRWIGLKWRTAVGMGLGLAQMGEFSFILLSVALRAEAIGETTYQRMLFFALGTLILTPHLLKTGLRWADVQLDRELEGARPIGLPGEGGRQAIVIGAGPIGCQLVSQLELGGLDVCLVDLSPVNLHAFAQQGFHTVAGDATDADVLRRAEAATCSLALVTVPNDAVARQIVKTLRRLNRTCAILVRCRYQSNVAGMKLTGADAVVSEESEATAGLLRLLERVQEKGGGVPGSGLRT